MLKGSYNPKAFLLNTKNVKQGLASRSQIASLLETNSFTAKTISEHTNIRYQSVLHHLHLMENEHIVERKGGKPYLWSLTGAGQTRLTETWSNRLTVTRVREHMRKHSQYHSKLEDPA